MFRYSCLYINGVSFVISILIFLSIQFLFSNFEILSKKSVLRAGFKVENQISKESKKREEIKNKQDKKIVNKNELENKVVNNVENQGEWYLEIPSILLKANIKEGTTEEIMNQYIGHFEETSKLDGNIGLAAHNRGYPVNYFANLKKLKEGDLIFYKYKGEKKEYEVIKNQIIKDTDWTYLENTDKNMITLITCVENEPQYRRCVQGKEIKK